MKVSNKHLGRLNKSLLRAVRHIDDEEYGKSFIHSLQSTVLKYQRAVMERDGMVRANKRYTRDENIELACHVYDYLMRGEFPDFEEISSHMDRTAKGLATHTQKILVDSKTTYEDIIAYGLSASDAKKLVAPQHTIKK
jgi:hypothetical protein